MRRVQDSTALLLPQMSTVNITADRGSLLHVSYQDQHLLTEDEILLTYLLTYSMEQSPS